LYRCPDGRWRINATGSKFTCHDERQAIAHFLHWKSQQTDSEALVQIALPATDPLQDPDVAGIVDFIVRHELGPGLHRTPKDESLALNIPPDASDPMELLRSISERALYAYFRKQLIERLPHVAEMTGIPELLGLNRFDLPKPPVRIAAVIEAYKKHSTASEKSKKEAIKSFERLVSFAQARTLEDLTDDVLLAFRHSVVTDPKLTSSGTISGYFSRIRSVLRLAARGTLDAVQLEAMRARCKAKLYPPENNVEDDPHPIVRRDFHKLLAGAVETDIPHVWRAILLLALNCALYMEDICDLRWSAMDLQQKTYFARRKKRGRWVRAAVLWNENVEALRAIPRRGQSPYVFVSTHGTRYNKNTKINDFKDFREKIGAPGVVFSHLRDGAYTAASNDPIVHDRFARLLAGHKAHRLADKYVARHPEVVKPASDAVYREYFGSHMGK
jgi:integrase